MLALIDSTCWIDWLRRRVELRDVLGPWAAAGTLATCGVIRTEVVRGVVDPAQRDRVALLFDTFVDLPLDAALWRDTADLAWRLDRQGRVLPLTDLVIATAAQRAGAMLVTLDRHFDQVEALHIRRRLPALR